jgi:hypothetical protein
MKATALEGALAFVTGGGVTADKLATNAIAFANAQLGGEFRLGAPADGSKPINLWLEKGLHGYQVYVHDPNHGGTSVITDLSGDPLRIKAPCPRG